jgi:hypothetical protein
MTCKDVYVFDVCVDVYVTPFLLRFGANNKKIIGYVTLNAQYLAIY